jgi:hypothetical protein
MLGLHTIQDMGTGWDGNDGLDGMFHHLRNVYLGGQKTMSVGAGQA